MFGFINSVFFFYSNDIFGYSVSNVNPLKCVSMKNQECRIRPEIININSN